ncbi:hypothetical protein BD779DRAFT_1147447 [Infundibulicybe gibba]|nr:hypothetical protein BD779DRAFT_1147447 [Infundibulicybe gibba]
MENIPVEIIQRIFLELCSQSTRFPLRRDEPRLIVTHVCSQWRAIALSTPILWANFSIYVWDSCLPLCPIRAWISRSGQSTLSFKLYNSTRDSETVINFVFPIIHRCSLLKLHLNTTTLNRLLTLPLNSLCALQSMTLLIEGNAPDIIPFSTAFQPCPELRKFSLTAFMGPKPLKIANFNVPWHQLTILRLDSSSISAHECLDIVPSLYKR